MVNIAGTVSVIIPAYNRENVIEECIRSVEAQNYQDFEIIIADDGSDDKTLEIVKKASENDTRIHVISLDHTGVSGARNAALDQAQGEYVFFLDSDDVIHPNLFQILVTDMKREGSAIAASRSLPVSQVKWSETVKNVMSEPGPGKTESVTFECALEAMLTSSSPLSPIGGVMIRRDWIGQTRFRSDLHIGEDFFFVYENLLKGTNCQCLKEKWYCLRIHDKNSSWDYSFDGFYSRFLRRKLVWESEEAHGRPQYAVAQKREAFSGMIKCINQNGSRSDAGKKMRAVMREHKKAMIPAMTGKGKAAYYMYLYFPWAVRVVNKIKKR